MVMKMYGYMGKILRVDLTTNKIKLESLEEDVIRNYLGGTGIATNIIYHELPPETDPLSRENKLVFATGPLTGTLAPMTCRYVVAGKSPLTGIWGEADSGGFWAAELKYAGFDAIIVEGASKTAIYLWVCDGNAVVKDAKHLWGMDTFETEESIKKETDSKAKVASIGQAGENLVKLSVITNDGGRVAARSGLGAVMGSKKLKAIAVKGEKKVEVADPEMLKELRKQITEDLRSRPPVQALSKYGTGAYLDGMLEERNLPLKNWLQNTWDEKSAISLSGVGIAETIRTAMRSCYGCPVGCEKVVRVKEGQFLTEEGRGPEYETVAALGSLCLNSNIEAIAKSNDLCNRYGLDTIEAGTIIAFAMECYERGILSKSEVGRELKWGDGEAIVELVSMIAMRDGFGDTLAEGVKGAAERIGRGASQFAMHVKGSSICMHDPRVRKPIGFNYATLPTGAYHGKVLPPKPSPDSSMASMVAEGQDFEEVVDCLTMCRFAFHMAFGAISREYVPKLILAVTGRKIDLRELKEIGERIVNMKRIFATKLGITRKDDLLPRRFKEIPRVRGDISMTIDAETMLPEYYKIRGWDENGIPRRETLEKLGITHLGGM